MESTTDIALQNVASSPTRIPLLEKPNSPPPSPTPMKHLRRKSSFIRKIDSSEESSSLQDSIYEAHYFSSTTSDESFSRIEQTQMARFRGADTTTSNDENNRTIPNSTVPSSEDVQFRYGHGTILETITEQKSKDTMHSLAYSRSENDIREMKGFFLAHKDSVVLAQSRSPRRKQSFSLDDLNMIGRSYHEACSIIERTARKPLNIHEIYASPKIPIHDPLERPSTPPGMPSWTAAQTPTPPIPRRAYHIPGTPNRLQRFLGIEPSGITFSARVPQPDAVRAVSTPVNVTGARVVPRFRPPKSAYGGIDRHPFNNCPVAQVPQPRSTPSKRVRFTPSATARDSAELNLRSAMESTSGAALHPMAPICPMAPMLPIAQACSVSTKPKLCLHRRITHSTPTSISTMASPNNSTAHLMSGALSPSAESIPTSPIINSPTLRYSSNNAADTGGRGKKIERFIPCWKCQVERAARFWVHTTSCLCFVCCGFECDDESPVYPAGLYEYSAGSGYFDNQEVGGTRRMVLDQTPASMV